MNSFVRKTFFFFLLHASILSLICAKPANAETESRPTEKVDSGFSISATPIYQFDAPLHNGSVSVFRLNTNLKWFRKITSNTEAGLSLAYDYADFRFSGQTTLAGGTKPWGTIHTLTLGGSIQHELSPDWKLMVAPSISVAREDDANWHNATGYGGYTALIRNITPDLSLGLGAGAYNSLGEVSFFAGLAVRWQITDRLLLANPLRPGLTGPAGMELSYRIDNGWNIGSGLAYRHSRFRLNSNSFTQDGIGDVTSIPAWIRLSRELGRDFNLDFYGGAMLGGTMQIENSDGTRLSSDRHQPAPFMAMTITGRF